MESTQDNRIVLLADFCKKYAGDVTPEHGYRILKHHKDQFPPALRLPGGRKIFFRQSDVDEWLANLAKAASGKRRPGRPSRLSESLRRNKCVGGSPE